MAQKIVWRSADIDLDEAIEQLRQRYPNARIASFKDDTVLPITTEAAHLLKLEKRGNMMLLGAKLVLGEFPPAEDDEAEKDDEPAGPPHPEPDADDEGGPSDDDEDDEPKEKSDSGEKKSPKKDKGDAAEHSIEHKLDLIMQTLGIPAGDEMGDVPGEDGPPKPPAPPAPGPAGPPMPPVEKKAPLPPPAAPSGGLGGLGSPMSKTQTAVQKHASQRRSIVVWRPAFDVKTASSGEKVAEPVTLKQAAAEIRAELPDFELAKIEKKMGRLGDGKPFPVLVCALVRK